MATATSTSCDGNTLRDGSTHHLKELNARTAPLGGFGVSIYRPKMEIYNFTDKRSGVEKTGSSFRCIVVSTSNQQQYIRAELPKKGDNAKPLEKAGDKFKEFLRFRMTKISLKTDVKQEFLHTPQKLQINIDGTKFDPLMAAVTSGDVSQLTPDPPLTVADCKGFQKTQRFDVTALVISISTARKVSETREVKDILLMDGSQFSNGKTAEIKLQFYHDKLPKTADREIIDLLGEVVGKPVPLSFFAVHGKQTTDGYSFENSRDFFLVKAASTHAKSKELMAKGVQLIATPQQEKETLQTTFSPLTHKDYTNEKGSETLCALLRNMDESTDIVKSIDENPTLWQGNWMEVTWPSGPELLTKDQTRLWFKTCLRDVSGSKMDVWMTEQSALALSGLADKDKFLKSWEDGEQTFPIMASVKITRTLQKPDGVGQPEGTADRLTNLTIVHASDQPFGEAPTQATVNLIHFLKDTTDDTSCILPAALHMIKESACYNFEVVYPSGCGGIDQAMPCQKIIALVRSTEKSVPDPNVKMAEGTFKLVTSNVECFLSSDDSHLASRKYSLTATCSMLNLPGFRLDPVRGKPQHALITITAKLGDNFVVETVQLLDAEGAAQAKESLTKLQFLAMNIQARDKKRQVAWTEEACPVQAKKCRILGRSGTDAAIERPAF